jgi:hypothetical protein
VRNVLVIIVHILAIRLLMEQIIVDRRRAIGDAEVGGELIVAEAEA